MSNLKADVRARVSADKKIGQERKNRLVLSRDPVDTIFEAA